MGALLSDIHKGHQITQCVKVSSFPIFDHRVNVAVACLSRDMPSGCVEKSTDARKGSCEIVRVRFFASRSWTIVMHSYAEYT